MNFLSRCRKFQVWKKKVEWHTWVKPYSILKLDYRDFFTHILLTDVNEIRLMKLPTSVRAINFINPNKIVNTYCNDLKQYLPNTINEFKFCQVTDISLNRIIGDSVWFNITHLEITMPRLFHFKSCQFPNVRHLTIGLNSEQLLDLFPNVMTLTLNLSTDQIQKIIIPQSVINLTFEPQYYGLLVIPNSVKNLTFNNHFTKNLSGCIPNSIVKLKFTHQIDDLKYEIPTSVLHLHLSDTYNQSLVNVLPPVLETLILGDKFDQPLNQCLPPTLKCLQFGRKFNCPLNNDLPASLIELIFGQTFNRPIIGQLPPALQYLKFGESFNRSLGTLPNSLLYLDLGLHFNQVLALPPRLVTLKLSLDLKYSLNSVLPASLQSLTINTPLLPTDKLPNTIANLILGPYYNDAVYFNIPNSVDTLTLGRRFRRCINIPSSVKYLKVYKKYLQLRTFIPNHLTILILD